MTLKLIGFSARNKLFAIVIIATLFHCNSYAQVVADTIKQLPFAIANEKKLSEEDLANKKEGFSITAIPQLSSDPVNGFGYGAEGFLYYNGKKSDPFFDYTPY